MFKLCISNIPSLGSIWFTVEILNYPSFWMSCVWPTVTFTTVDGASYQALGSLYRKVMGFQSFPFSYWAEKCKGKCISIKDWSLWQLSLTLNYNRLKIGNRFCIVCKLIYFSLAQKLVLDGLLPLTRILMLSLAYIDSSSRIYLTYWMTRDHILPGNSLDLTMVKKTLNT